MQNTSATYPNTPLQTYT